MSLRFCFSSVFVMRDEDEKRNSLLLLFDRSFFEIPNKKHFSVFFLLCFINLVSRFISIELRLFNEKTTTTIEKSRPESCALKISFGPDLIFLSLWFLFLNTSNYFSFVFLYENITTKNDEILFFSLNVFICFLYNCFPFFSCFYIYLQWHISFSSISMYH